MGDRAQKEAWVTLATNDAYALGCLVLGNSLRRVQTTRQMVVMVCEGVSQGMRYQLESVFDSLVEVDVLDSEDARNLSLLGRPDLNVTYTKIHCWQLTQYEKCVFLDADTLVIQHCDELFDREELSAAPDAGWPDCFNSGVFVFRPSLETYQSILNFAASKGSFDGGDQGLLNSYFNTWPTEDIMKHLPFIYNVVSQAFYSYLPAFTQFRSSIKIVHFIGAIKPWNHPYNTATRTVTVFPETGHCQEFLQMWWDLFMEMVQPRLDPTVGGLVGELAQMKVGGGGDTADYMVLDDRERRLAWERGHADYLGVDSFANIMKKLDEKMAPVPASKEDAKKSEGTQSETALVSKPAEVNEVGVQGDGGGGEVESVGSVAPLAESSAVEEEKVVLPSPGGMEWEGVAAPVSIPVAEEVSEPPPVEVASLVEAPAMAVPATIPVLSPETQPMVSASISLGGGGSEGPEEVTETISLAAPSSATYTAPPPVAEASVPLPQPSASATVGSAEESSSFTLPLTPPSAAPVSGPSAAVTVPGVGKKMAPVPEKKPPAPPKPQEKLTPLQIGKKPPPPTPEKPASPAEAGGTKSPPPPVPQKPTSPESPFGSKVSPLVPAKPASPSAATGVAAQRSMFEKPGPAAAKPAPKVGSSISAFAARFQQPPAPAPASKPVPGVAPKPSSPTSPGVGPKPSSPSSPSAAPTATGLGSAAAKPTSPSSAGAAPKPSPSAPSSSPAGQGSKNAEFLARYGLKKK